MGEVFEAEDCELKERVALKTVLPAIAADGRMLGRFKQEIQLSRKVSHPNVCRVFDLAHHPVDAAARTPPSFLTMEFLDGETLSARLNRQGRCRPREALPSWPRCPTVSTRPIAPASSTAISSPPTSCWSPPAKELRAVVTDFGLARSFNVAGETTATLTGILMGTLDYMSPELMTGAKATIASDVYAFGTTALR